jgi:hypothetical protein
MQRHERGRQRSRKTSTKTLNKRFKKGKTLMRRRGKNEKKSLKKIKIVGGGKREDLLKQKQILQEREKSVKEGNQDDFNSMLLRHIRRDIAKIDFELKPQEEQAAILARKSDASFALETQQKAQQALREEVKSKEQLEETRSRQARMQELSSQEKARVKSWESENESNLQNKSFVQSQLDELRARHKALTDHEQPRGAIAGYHTWYQSMVELLLSRGGV